MKSITKELAKQQSSRIDLGIAGQLAANYKTVSSEAFYFEPVAGQPTGVGGLTAFGDYTFETRLTDQLEERSSVVGDVSQ